MKLISEQWIHYLHEKKEEIERMQEGLYPILYEYDLKRFSYEIEGGYRTIDTGLEDFPCYIFVFLTNRQEMILVQVSTDFPPIVRIQDRQIPLTSYYQMEEKKGEFLQRFFITCGKQFIQQSF